MIIKNFENLATSPLRKQALFIAEAGFRAVDTSESVGKNFVYDPKNNVLNVQGKEFELAKFKKIICVGFGKAAFLAAKEVQNILKEKLTEGYVISLEEGNLGKIVSRKGTHPHLSHENIKYTKELVSVLESLGSNDLVITIISGGGSALLADPYEIDVQSHVKFFDSLTRQGANITELNTARKHLSKVKGGQLAKIIYPATCIGLIFSDVPGDDVSVVASGPTVKDKTTVRDAMQILKKYKVLENCNMRTCKLTETPKEEKYFQKVHNFTLVSGMVAISAMREKSEDLGFKTKVFSKSFEGEARVLGQNIVEVNQKGECLIGSGESTVRIKGKGKGGRNQEMALSGLSSIRKDQVFSCLASDGHDNTEAAGAMADDFTRLKAKRLKLEPQKFLERNDSFNFFEQVDDLIDTGPTGSNVADFFICLRN